MVRWYFIALIAGCGFSVSAPEATSGDDTPPPDAMIDATTSTGGEDSGTDSGATPMTFDLAATADTFLRAQFPDNPHNLSYQRCGSGNPGYLTNRAMYRFDLSTLPATCVITKADLRAYFFDQDYNRSPTLSAYRVAADWTESQATWNQRVTGVAWAAGGGDFDATALASVVATSGQYGWLAWDITSTAAAWFAGQPNYGVIVVEPGDLDGAFEGRKFFYTSEVSNAAFRPHLRVTCL